jgi:hypothetical protein
MWSGIAKRTKLALVGVDEQDPSADLIYFRGVRRSWGAGDHCRVTAQWPDDRQAQWCICGFPLCKKVPTEAAFSPALDKFAAGRPMARVHEALITEHLVSEQLPLPAGDRAPRT